MKQIFRSGQSTKYVKVVLKMTKTMILEIFHTQSRIKSATNNLNRIFGHILRRIKSYFLQLTTEAQLKKRQNSQPVKDLKCYGTSTLSTNYESVTVVSLIQDHNSINLKFSNNFK